MTTGFEMDFPKIHGPHYVEILKRVHQEFIFDWYLEIGCRHGDSFADVRSKTIAIDPFFRVSRNIIESKKQLHIFQTTSDDFFEGNFLKKNEILLDCSFIDGMHLFEFLLRDFINCEANSKPTGVIALHDCVPQSFGMTVRDFSKQKGGGWTGDVWKIIPILRKYRPDLRVTVLDCVPTGLVLVDQLNPKNVTLKENYTQIVEDWSNVDLNEFGVSEFFKMAELADSKNIRNAVFPIFEAGRVSEVQFTVPTYVSP